MGSAVDLAETRGVLSDDEDAIVCSQYPFYGIRGEVVDIVVRIS